ncbi:hypothetical protein DFA_07080 [Cavenderia fasciculata]|uniref:NAD(P)-binding domain-containing protein n=1 Tax=Cavenderia fasciculata TaxID=261658 RepID=F4PVF5_CACFS|nr:uncharacterized protein DFA_07080 [Cavenderia fasciculata]EGG19969.1 hypothetical protein DFA_07080 [Cavenderia fasciculata]|eukprot:XP_004366952.1 hypothetical protein DFA_07080 [Cavenderia fasciculata]
MDKSNLIVFMTGASGYIGGSVFTSLLKDGYKEIRVLVRQKEQAEIFKKIGTNVTPVIGSLDDSDQLEKESHNANVVLSTADADHLPSVKAMLKGSSSRHQDKNSPSVFIQTSGTGLLTWQDCFYTQPYDDNNYDDIHKRISITAPHRNVDQWIFDHCPSTNGLMTAIIAPSTIYGIGSGPIKKNSVQVMILALAAVARRKAGYVNPEGYKAQWDNVRIEDVVQLFSLLIDGLLNKSIDHGTNGFYSCCANTHTWGDVAKELGKELKKRGLVDTEEISEFEKQYVDRYLWGENKRQWMDSRGLSNRSKKIGWKPSGKSLFETIPSELDYLISIDYFNKNK